MAPRHRDDVATTVTTTKPTRPTTLLLASTSPLSGKSAFAVGIGRALQGQGYAVGYCQPLLLEHDYDQLSPDHVAFIREALRLRGESDARIAPVRFSAGDLAEGLRDATLSETDLTERITAAFTMLACDKDVMLVEGPDTRDEGSVVGLTACDQARLLGARVLVVARGHESSLVDRIVAFQRELGDLLLGVVLNVVPRGSLSYVTNTLVPALERIGVAVFGVVPEDRTLRSVSVGQVAGYLDGRILCAEDQGSALLEHVVVGAMSVEAALDHLARRERTALVTGGDRTDLLTAALNSPEVTQTIAAFILTGDLYPSPRVLALAGAQGLPVVLVRHDTRTATDLLDKVFGRVRFAQTRKIERFTAIMTERFDFVRFARLLGLD
ncbi:MAG: DRTGG domain-containing protein [Thermomicrobiales bacterium]